MGDSPSRDSRVENLAPGGVAALFRRVLNSGYTGRIIFRNGQRSCSFYFMDGFIVNARTNNEDHRLGEILEQERDMDPATVRQGLKLGKVRNQPLGMVLLKEKLIHPRVLYETLVRQVELISLECAAWDTGTATLYPGVTLGKKAVLLRISPATALESAFSSTVPAAPAVSEPEPPKPKPPKAKAPRPKEARAKAPEPEPPAPEPPAPEVPEPEPPAPEVPEPEPPEPEPPEPEPLPPEPPEPEPLPPEPLPPEPPEPELPAPELPAPEAPKKPEAPFPGEELLLEELRNELLEKESLPPEEYYRLLGVKPDASGNDIRGAYEAMVKRWHPDRIGEKLGTDDGRRAQALFARINEAYGVVGDERGREIYDERRRKEFTPKPAGAAGKISSVDEANRLFKAGIQAMREREFNKATEYLKKACQLDPLKAGYHYYLGAAHYRGSKNLKQAEEALLKAIELDGSAPDYYVALGKVYKAGKLYRRAREMFDRALIWDSDNAAALREKRDLPEL